MFVKVKYTRIIEEEIEDYIEVTEDEFKNLMEEDFPTMRRLHKNIIKGMENKNRNAYIKKSVLGDELIEVELVKRLTIK